MQKEKNWEKLNGNTQHKTIPWLYITQVLLISDLEVIKFPILIQASLLALSGHEVHQQIPSEHCVGHFTHQVDQLRTWSRFPPTCKVSIVLFFDHSCASLVTICSILCHFIDQSRTGDLRAKQNQKTQCLYFWLQRFHLLCSQKMHTTTQEFSKSQLPCIAPLKKEKVFPFPQWQSLKHFHPQKSDFFSF